MEEQIKQTEQVTSEETKFCTRCKRNLPLSCYSRKLKSKDGLQHYCKECQREQHKKANTDNTNVVTFDSSMNHRMCKVYSHPELAKFTHRQLMAELKARGFRWEWMLEPQKKIMFDKI